MGDVLAADRWMRLRPLLDRALDLDASGRAGLMAALEVQSPTLKADLERLLQHHASDPVPAGQQTVQISAEQLVAPSPAAGPFANTVIGAFRLETLIGSGGMGAVYRARRISGGFEQTVAIKLITGLHPGLERRFARERQILADLNHPKIGRLLDGGETTAGFPYLVMEYIEGDSLVDYCTRTAASLDRRLELLVDVAEALAYAHQRKLIHRDIKPGNILVSASGELKLLDFGIAKLLDDSEHSALTQQAIGPMTPAYAAPEQFSGEPLGPATDIYQFGVLAFRLLCGHSPYKVAPGNPLALALAVAEGKLHSLRTLLSGARPVPTRESSVELPEASPPAPADLRADSADCADLDRILRRCLQRAPAERYPDMHSLIADLRTVRGNLAQTRGASGGRKRLLQAPPSGQRLGSLVALALAAMLVAVGAWFWQPWQNRSPASAGVADTDWQNNSALNGLGLEQSMLHCESSDCEQLIRQALFFDARGDTASARAMLESVHRADTRTPVAAMLLTYWAQNPTAGEVWRAAAETRMQPLTDASLNLLWRFIQADHDSRIDDALRYSAALLEVRPAAWFLRLARAHRLIQLDLREAALRELQQIDNTHLGHRKLSDAIADRASLGDLKGASALAAKLQVNAEDPDFAQLRARLAYTSGDLRAAGGYFAEAVRIARQQARFDIEGRGLLYQAVVWGSLGEFAKADEAARAARQRFRDRGSLHLTIDSSLVLAQLAAFNGDRKQIADHIGQARAMLANADPGARDPRIELYAARLLGEAPQAPEGLDAATLALFEARSAMLAGDRKAAAAAATRAAREGIEKDPMVEEYWLLQLELGHKPPRLPPVDPPFQPYVRFSGRWALGAGDSVAGRQRADAR